MKETINKEVVLEDIKNMQHCLLSMHDAMQIMYSRLEIIKREAEKDV